MSESFLEGIFTYKTVKISKIQQISKDSKVFTCALPLESQTLGIFPGQHISIRAFIISDQYPKGKTIKHKYTPISSPYKLGSFDLLIKVYYPGKNYSGGRLTMHLDRLKIGDNIEISGPRGKYIYNGDGIVKIRVFFVFSSLKKFTQFGFIAGGSGIAPCYQYIQYIIENNENFENFLIFSNKNEDDILLRDKLNYFEKNKKLSLFYTLTENPDEHWPYGRGYVNELMIQSHFPKPSENIAIFYSGPKGMSIMLKKLLSSMNYLYAYKF